MRYIIFTRVSTDKQKVENQVKECKEFVNRHWKDGDELLEFAEPEMSSRTPLERRAVLKAMLAEVKKGDTVVVYKLDRIARNGKELVNIYDDLIEKGVRVHSIYEPTADQKYVHIYAFVAMTERENIRLRTISGLNRKKASLERVGTTWYGYKLNENVLSQYKGARSEGKPYLLVVDEQEAAAVKIMSNMRSEGKSYQTIADELERLGFKNRAGKPIQKNSIRRILLRQGMYPVHEVQAC